MFKNSDFSDSQLIQAFTQGDSNAFGQLILRHKDRVFTSIYLLTKDKFLSEDIFQEVFIKIIDTIRDGRYNDEGKFLPWAIRIAHNACIDYFRKIKRNPVIKTGDDKDIFEVLGFVEESAEQKIITKERDRSLHKMIDQLPEDQKEVIVLRHFADMSFKEIAQITGCSINTALGRMRYGIINLRKMLVHHQHSIA